MYLRSETRHGYHTELIINKNRLPPAKDISIPRLELLSTLIEVRATQYVEKQLQLTIVRKVIKTDSKCVLYWMKTSKILSFFVTNRLAEIKQAKAIEMQYLPTKDNAGDLVARSRTLQELVLSQRWWKGPEWFYSSENLWPHELKYRDLEDETWQEEYKNEVLIITKEPSWSNVMGFSNRFKLLRVVVYILQS